ncbi:MAG: hypothetical protein ABSC62_01785 [Terracidiphilus sp.]
MRQRTAWAALLAASALPLCGQTAAGGSSLPSVHGPLASAEPAQAVTRPEGEILGQIDDPHTGIRWLLMRDTANAGGPGRLVRIGHAGPDAKGGTRGAASGAARLRPLIHAGDALIVEEHTAVVDAWLAAVALGPAAAGAECRARLKIGGKVVRVVALASGRAELAPDGETRP